MKYFILIFLFNFKSYSEDHISCYSKKDIKRFYYANGIYIVNITTEDEQLFTEKLIKN